MPGSANIDLPKNLTYESLLQYWEKKFWLTEFSHLGGNGNPTRSNLVLVTKTAKEQTIRPQRVETVEQYET